MESDALTEIEFGNCILQKFDFGAYGSRGLAVENATAAVVCGHPYIDQLRGAQRIDHLRFLATCVHEGRLKDFCQSRGSFSFACVEANSCRLTLAADCLGIRPLYYSDDGERVIFSSTLAPFRQLGRRITGGRCERGSVEMAVFGYSLGDRTEWERVRCVPSGSALVFTREPTVCVKYWSMSAAPQIRDSSEQETLKKVFDAFTDAVLLRCVGESVVLAMLSGGMDSRAVVAMLRTQGIEVNSLNFAPAGSQDLVYGRGAAEALGCNHAEVAMEGGVLDGIRSALRPWQKRQKDGERTVEHPYLVWTGDGGSVTLGHVYLTDDAVQLAEAGKCETAIELLLSEQSWVVPRRVLRKERVQDVSAYLKKGLLEELSELKSSDPGRRLHLLLMATNQRRHMYPHFELIYEHRCELQMPFFDKNLVETIISRPVGPFLRHRFYNKWFGLFQSAATSVPWQSYPGHEVCPVVSREDLTYQWTQGSMSATHRKEQREYVLRAARALLARKFGATAVSPGRVAIALAATALGVRDLTYALRFSSVLAEG